jgi:adenylate cyclase
MLKRSGADDTEMGENGRGSTVPYRPPATASTAKSSAKARLCCVMFADLVGYTTLMEANEAETVAAVSAIQRLIVLPRLDRHDGRLIRTTGDGFFAEFGTATNAVNCAIEIQRAMAAREEAPPLAFRIGINLGEMTDEGDDIYGRDVNVAARLETLSEPQGICISSAVHDAVVGRVHAEFEDAGISLLRNISRPIHVWRWCPEERSYGVGGIASGQLSLPSRPSLAVLPFTNMSADPDQDYFADGLVDEIITALAKVRWFFVIARNSTFVYKGRAVDIRQVARELGVRYVLEGSVRRSGDQLRIVAQLIDGSDGSHLWAETIAGKIDQIFELQDSISESVAGAIEPKLRSAEIERARRKPTASLDAYDYFLRALPHLVAATSADLTAAIRLLDRAIALDPRYAAAYAAAAQCRWRQLLSGAVTATAEFQGETVRLARKAVQLDPGDPEALSMAAVVIAQMDKDYVAAREWADAATRLNPSSCYAWSRSAGIRCWTSDFATSAEYFRRALRLSPADPWTYAFQSGLGMALLFLGNFPEAIDWFRRALSNNRNHAPSYRLLAVALVQSGRLEEAKQVVQQMRAIDPISSLSRSEFFTGFRDPEPKRLYLESLRAAGLPE